MLFNLYFSKKPKNLQFEKTKKSMKKPKNLTMPTMLINIYNLITIIIIVHNNNKIYRIYILILIKSNKFNFYYIILLINK